MPDDLSGRATPLGITLGWSGAVDCVIVPLLFAAGQDPLFPLPGLYFMEIVLLGLLGLAALSGLGVPWPAVEKIPWLVAGAILAFVVLGAWTIGLFLIPALLAFLAGGIQADWRSGRRMAPHLALFALASVVQGALMIALIGLA